MDWKDERLRGLKAQLNDKNVAGRKLSNGVWWLPRVRDRIKREIKKLEEQ